MKTAFLNEPQTLCLSCGWEGKTSDCIHSKRVNAIPGSVTRAFEINFINIDLCPECKSDDLAETK